MAMQLRWVGEPELDRVAETRMRCYAKAAGDLETYKMRTRGDPRGKAGDYLLAEMEGRAVGTATSLSLNMWCRGASISCQGVAWVGAIKTMRRKGSKGTRGVASAVMREILRMARERGHVVSALIPFRASYYEHFGYGIVERCCDWTLPIDTLPTGEFDSIRFAEPDDFQARAEGLQRVSQAGQCEVERSLAFWKTVQEASAGGFTVVDRIDNGPVRGYLYFLHQQVDGKDIVKVADCFYENVAALRRQLHFLSSLKDQFATVQITLPVDVPLNRLLNESQIPHRPVNHPVSSCQPYTRMQVRILDHTKFLQSLHLPKSFKGKVTVAVHECEGQVSRFNAELEGGRIHCEAGNASADFECADRTWAAIACGDLKARDAVRFGLATGDGTAVLDALGEGPMPYTHEHF